MLSFPQKVLILAIKKDIIIKIIFYPYFHEDFKRLNRELEPKLAIYPYILENKLSKEENQRRISQGKGFSFKYLFFYE